jgi:hypothetical protein
VKVSRRFRGTYTSSFRVEEYAKQETSKQCKLRVEKHIMPGREIVSNPVSDYRL